MPIHTPKWLAWLFIVSPSRASAFIPMERIREMCIVLVKAHFSHFVAVLGCLCLSPHFIIYLFCLLREGISKLVIASLPPEVVWNGRGQ